MVTTSIIGRFLLLAGSAMASIIPITDATANTDIGLAKIFPADDDPRWIQLTDSVKSDTFELDRIKYYGGSGATVYALCETGL